MIAIYCRISKDREGEVSTEVQKQRGIEFAKENGMKYKVYTDRGISGGADIEDRPQFLQMFREIDKRDSKITAVYAYDPSRLYRSEKTKFSFLSVVAKRNIDIYFSGKKFDWSDPTEKMIHSITTTVNQFQLDITSDKIKSALLHNAKEGKTRGIYPYGYTKDKDGVMVIHPEEAKVVKRIYQMSLNGTGTGKIARILNEEGIPTRYNKIAQKQGNATYKAVDHVRGKKTIKKKSDAQWRDKTVRDIITNTVYKGERIFSGEVYQVDPIIPPAQWKRVNEHLKENRNTHHGNAKRYEYLLRGFLVCGRCGRNYHGRVAKKDNFYMCTSKRFPKENCGNRAINRPFLEEFVWFKFFTSGEFEKHLKKYFDSLQDKENLSVLRRRKKKLEKDLDGIKKGAEEARKYLYEGIITPEDFKEDIKRMDHERGLILERISEVESELYGLENVEKTEEGVKKDLILLAKDLPLEKKREFLAKYLDYIEVDDINETYFLRFHFKLANMRSQLYYMERDYSIAWNITDQPLDPTVSKEEHLKNNLVWYLNHPSFKKTVTEAEQTNAQYVGFYYYATARRDYLEAKES